MSYRNNRKKDKTKINNAIRARTVQLINEDDENQGEISTREALEKAKELEMDLVEVAPNANPPVCKIIDYSKYKYEQDKKRRRNKSSGKERKMKEFRFTPVIQKHDIDTRVKRALEYLEKGHPVRITMYRKGRQTRKMAKDTFNKVLTNFADFDSIEPRPKTEGRHMYITFKK